MTYWAKVTELVKDKYLTWKTGKDRAEREWLMWYDLNVNWLAHDITDMFKNFKHVIIVDVKKFTNPHEPFSWVPCNDAKQYFWPARELDNNAVWRFERVEWNEWDKRWHITDFGGQDLIFVATNNDKDALMIALKYS